MADICPIHPAIRRRIRLVPDDDKQPAVRVWGVGSTGHRLVRGRRQLVAAYHWLMLEDQPLVAGENQGLGCPLFDALPHRHILDGDEHIIELVVRDEMRGPGGAVHGGLVAILIDTAGACAVTRASKRPPATSNLSISYLAAGRIGPLRAEAAALRIGQHHGVCDVRVYDVGRDHRLIATATVTINFLDGSDFEQKTD